MDNITKMINDSKKGSAIVEFMIVFPAFIFVCFMVIEISLIWIDKHFLKLASFEAARSLITEVSENPCDASSAKYADNMTRAKRAAALKVASISPSLTKLAAEAGININSSSANASPATGSSLVNAFLHLLVRLPSAYALTQVECTALNDKSLKVKVTYWRSARLPFVRDAIWASYVLIFLNKKLAVAGLDGLFAFSLDELYHGIQIDVKKVGTQIPDAGFVKNKIVSTLKHISGMKLDFAKANAILSQIPGVDELNLGYFDLSQQLNNVLKIPEAEALQNDLNSQSRILTSVVYALPDVLRLIPLHAETRLSRFKIDNEGDPWDNGFGFLIAPFSTKNIRGVSGDKDHNWRYWALGMSEDRGHWHAN